MDLTVDQTLQQGVAAHSKGKLEEAERLYRSILQTQPEHPDANHNLGLIAISMNKTEDALALFHAALKANPNIEQFWISYIDALIQEKEFENAMRAIERADTRGVAKDKIDALVQKLISVEKRQTPSQADIQSLLKYYQAGFYDDAEKLATSITQQFPTHQFSWKVLGAILNRAGKVSEALTANQKAVEIDSQDAEAHSNLSVTLLGLGKLEDAEESCTKAIALKPEFPQAHCNLGDALHLLGRLEEAAASYRKAVAQNPRYVEAYYNLGVTLKALGKLEETEAAYRKAVALKPDYAEAHNNLGVALKARGKLEDAEASYRAAVALKPDYPGAYSNLGNTLKALGKLEDAESSYRKAIALKEDFAEAHSNLGNILKELGKLEDAEASCRKAITMKPAFAEAHSNLGATLQELGRLKDAEASYRKAIAVKPDFAEAYNDLGNTLRQLGRLEEAEANYRKAIECKPDFAGAHSKLAVTLSERGRVEEAIASFAKALKIAPDFAEARHLLASLNGETTNSAPRVYVENLFDDYASQFDRSLIEKLGYNIPKKITEMIITRHHNFSLGSVLDLGCGTGLTGVEIRAFCKNLAGVDLSKSMLEQARNKNVYDKLTHRDIVDYLSTEDMNFDYFISTDVFIYLGNLSDVFQLIKSRNRSSGKLVFSTEHTDRDAFFLEPSGRYSHSKKYIESLCKKFDYKLSFFKKSELRKEKGKFLSAGLYVLDF